MPRTILTLLLIPGVLLTQFAAVPHAHGGGPDQPPTHHSHPHFHFHQLNPAKSVCELAAARCCSILDSAVPVVPFMSAEAGDAPRDHDEDAVYVEVSPGAPERVEHDGGESQRFGAPPALLLPLDFLVCVLTRPEPPPVARATVSPLYVRYRALII